MIPKNLSISLLLALLTLLSLQARKTAAICKKTCENCTGKDYCVVKRAPGCIEGSVDCLDECLDLDIRNVNCFNTSIPDGNTCDKSCPFCIKDYRCNIEMHRAKICDDDVFECTKWRKCLDGEPKRLCAGIVNNGNCHESCDTCIGSDNCAVSNSPECSKRKINCFDKCLHKGVRQAECFNSTIPDGINCGKGCNFCLDQFKCNDVLKNASTCKGENIDCVKNSECATKNVLDSCGMERNAGECGCGACFTKVDCKSNDMKNKLYGLCAGDEIICNANCVSASVSNNQCETFGFCTLAKGASVWKKAQCFVIAIIVLSVVIGVVCCFCCCGSRDTIYVKNW